MNDVLWSNREILHRLFRVNGSSAIPRASLDTLGYRHEYCTALTRSGDRSYTHVHDLCWAYADADHVRIWPSFLWQRLHEEEET